MSATQHGPTPKDPSRDLINRHDVHNELPRHRTVEQALLHADTVELALKERVLPFAEDWDLVILAREIHRLRRMIDIP